jgi:mxaA protein
MNLSRLLLAALSCLCLISAHADQSDGTDPRVTIRTIEPARDVGYTVGDILTRTIIMEVRQPYELLPTSLPVPGNDKKRQNRGSGIEVRDVTVEKSSGAGTNIYTLHLSYQVFTNKVVARPASLPPEFVKFGGRGENFSVRIPSWNFRISPLSVFGAVDIEKDMSPFRGPLLLDSTRNRQLLQLLAGVLGLSALGLLYILGTRAWLPRMGRPFSHALRDLKRYPADEAGIAQAVTRLHQAFNLTSGAGVFDAASFITRNPGFAAVSADIERFFRLSRAVFFEPSADHGIDGDVMLWLRQFCRRCRDCERGLS